VAYDKIKEIRESRRCLGILEALNVSADLRGEDWSPVKVPGLLANGYIKLIRDN
jgi:hypothetical protein